MFHQLWLNNFFESLADVTEHELPAFIAWLQLFHVLVFFLASPLMSSSSPLMLDSTTETTTNDVILDGGFTWSPLK